MYFIALGGGLGVALEPKRQLGHPAGQRPPKGGSLDAGGGSEAVVDSAPWARMASGELSGEGNDTSNVSTLWGSNPGSTLHSLARLRIISPAPAQQHERQRHFHDHENPLRAMPDAARPAPSLFERFVKIVLRSLERRRQAEEDSRQHGHGQRKEQHASVEMDLLGARQGVGQHLERRLSAPSGQEQTEAAAGEGEQEALGEKLPDHASLARAQRRADGEFAGATGGARQQQIRHVHAGNEENKTHGGQQNQEKRRMPPTTSCLSETSVMPVPLSASGYSSQTLPSASMSACACSSITPGLSLPTASTRARGHET